MGIKVSERNGHITNSLGGGLRRLAALLCIAALIMDLSGSFSVPEISSAAVTSSKAWGKDVTDAKLNVYNGRSYYWRLPGVNMYACTGYAEWALNSVYGISVPSYPLVAGLRSFFMNSGTKVIASGGRTGSKYYATGSIMPGDIVFFYSRSRGAWMHVAIAGGRVAGEGGMDTVLHHNGTVNGIHYGGTIRSVINYYSQGAGSYYQAVRVLGGSGNYTASSADQSYSTPAEAVGYEPPRASGYSVSSSKAPLKKANKRASSKKAATQKTNKKSVNKKASTTKAVKTKTANKNDVSKKSAAAGKKTTVMSKDEEVILDESIEMEENNAEFIEIVIDEGSEGEAIDLDQLVPEEVDAELEDDAELEEDDDTEEFEGEVEAEAEDFDSEAETEDEGYAGESAVEPEVEEAPVSEETEKTAGAIRKKRLSVASQDSDKDEKASKSRKSVSAKKTSTKTAKKESEKKTENSKKEAPESSDEKEEKTEYSGSSSSGADYPAFSAALGVLRRKAKKEDEKKKETKDSSGDIGDEKEIKDISESADESADSTESEEIGMVYEDEDNALEGSTYQGESGGSGPVAGSSGDNGKPASMDDIAVNVLGITTLIAAAVLAASMIVERKMNRKEEKICGTTTEGVL